jgi:gliding motility-associated-like protein
LRFFFYILILISGVNLNAQTIVAQQNGSFRICKGKITDSDKGKIKGDYDHNENYTLKLSLPGATSITLKFSSFCTEQDNDVLRIFNGKDTNSPLIGKYSGNTSPGTVSSTDSFITLHFISDKSVACFGWEAEIINTIKKPTAANFTWVNKPTCGDSVLHLKSNMKIAVDSFNINNTAFSPTLPITSIVCTDSNKDFGTYFTIKINGGITTNATYFLTHTHGYRDYCDSIYPLKSSLSILINDCPIKVKLSINKDTICKGGCVYLSSVVTGGNTSAYKFQWTNFNPPGNMPYRICPSNTVKIKLLVSDGVAVPGSDSITITVINPPSAQKDTDVCYYGNNFNLQANPPGGKWYGKGIVNTTTGEFKPLGNYGICKVWYQIGDCADTVLVNVTIPWNLENVFCPGTKAIPLYWYAPMGGTWTGPKVSSNGNFTPDSAGTFVLTYSWKGCNSNKTIVVSKPVVPDRDTTCESRTLDTLSFSPKGIYPNYFPGLINSYYCWYNPSVMGGPGTKAIIFNAAGGCKDTTLLTVLPCYAGKDDTLCPSQTNYPLINLRHGTSFSWKGKGISNPLSSFYDCSWTNGNDGIDTLIFNSGKCTDTKIIHIISTKIQSSDTVEVCGDKDSIRLSSVFKTSVYNGIWSGSIVKNATIYPKNENPGLYLISYQKNTCSDNIIINILDKPITYKDTSFCVNSPKIPLKSWAFNDKYSGPGISKVSSTYYLSPISLNPNNQYNIFYTSDKGCSNTFVVTIDSMPKITWKDKNPVFCLNTLKIDSFAIPYGGNYSSSNFPASSSLSTFNLGSGSKKLFYTTINGNCIAKDSIIVQIRDTLQFASAKFQTQFACKGDITLLETKGKGGTGNYTYSWSHNQTGSKSYITALNDTIYSVFLNDGCSQPDTAYIKYIVHPPLKFIATTSDSSCFGASGFIKLQSINNNPLKTFWNPNLLSQNDTFWGISGNSYRVFAIDSITGCSSDTTISIPGFRSIIAGFTFPPSRFSNCYSTLDLPLNVYNISIGGTKYQWLLNDSIWDITNNIDKPKSLNWSLKPGKNTITLFAKNDAGCLDFKTSDLCFVDTCLIFLPTAFTPNNDGLNDNYQWHVYGVNEAMIQIFNRWGESIFTSTELNGHWNGIDFQGIPYPEDYYVIYIEYKSATRSKRFQKQVFYLLKPKDK